jgi:hypothetical protein
MIFNHNLPPDDDSGAAWSEAAARVPSPQRPELRPHTIGRGAELADPEGRRMSGHPAVQQALRNPYFDGLGLPRLYLSAQA